MRGWARCSEILLVERTGAEEDCETVALCVCVGGNRQVRMNGFVTKLRPIQLKKPPATPVRLETFSAQAAVDAPHRATRAVKASEST
jgi:hypothetical protein